MKAIIAILAAESLVLEAGVQQIVDSLALKVATDPEVHNKLLQHGKVQHRKQLQKELDEAEEKRLKDLDKEIADRKAANEKAEREQKKAAAKGPAKS